MNKERQSCMTKMDELNQKLAAMELAVKQQQTVIMEQQQQINMYRQQEVLQNQFLQLSSKDVLQQFRHIRPLDGTQPVCSFFKSVENVLQLCGSNVDLTRFGIEIIRNEKIMGDAGRSIQELEDDADWNLIKSHLKQHFRPRRTYGEIFNSCRMVKVSTLRELFSYFEKAKFDLNELYEFDGKKSTLYSPQSINRDLVDILLEKIDAPIRAHIIENNNLNEVIVRYTNLKLLDDTRCIDFRHRRQQTKIKSNSNLNQQYEGENVNQSFKNINNMYTFPVNKSELQKCDAQVRNYQYKQQDSPAQQHHKNTSKLYDNSNSSRFRNKDYSTINSNNRNNGVEPMDIANIDDCKFLRWP